MNLQQIEHALLFLGRAELRGNEVAAFVDVTNGLHQLRHELMHQNQPQPLTPTAPKPRKKKIGE